MSLVSYSSGGTPKVDGKSTIHQPDRLEVRSIDGGEEQVVCTVNFERFAVYVDSGHGSVFFVNPPEGRRG